MTRWTLCAAIAAACAAAPATAAVTLDPGGLGQGLLFPYFSTHDGQSTLVTVQNTTAQGKAVKLRVLESHAGAETLTFNAYLAPHATWSFSLTQTDPAAGAFARMLPGTDTCTAPQLVAAGFELLPYEFAGDGGPQTGERSREGFVEVIEMGTLSAALSDAAGTAARNCQTFSARFMPGAIWTTNPNADLSAPSGGLRGTAVLVHTANGTAFDYRALAFDGLAVAPRQYSIAGPVNPDFELPRLVDVQVPAGEDIEARVRDADGTPVTLRFDADDGYRAISALLASHAATATVNVEPGLRARTEWVYSMPTRRAHRQATIVGTPPPGVLNSPPFEVNASNCESVAVSLVDTAGDADADSRWIDLCGSAGVLRFAADDSELAPLLAQDDDVTVDTTLTAGMATLAFDLFDTDAANDERTSAPDLDGRCVTGLPVWTMALSAFDNDNAQEGRIATYPVADVASSAGSVVDCGDD